MLRHAGPDDAASLPGVGEVIRDKRELPDLLARRGLEDVPNGISGFEGRHRAWVKIQDGCRERCSYCIIPLVRPVLASRPADEVLDEIRRLIRAGFAEIVLTGIHLGHYGLDPDLLPSTFGRGTQRIPGGEGHALVDLLRRIIAFDGEFRLRLSSIEAAEVTPELLGLMAEHPQRICPHLHIPMQSGSDAILKKMRRHWPVRRFIDRCREIRAPAGSTGLDHGRDRGFSGRDGRRILPRLVGRWRKRGFPRFTFFASVPDKGPRPPLMPNRVPQRIHQRWAAELANLGKRLARRYLEELRGKRLQVLVEGISPESQRYACWELPTVM